MYSAPSVSHGDFSTFEPNRIYSSICNTRTSIRTMALIVGSIIAVAIFTRWDVSPLAEQSIVDTSKDFDNTIYPTELKVIEKLAKNVKSIDCVFLNKVSYQISTLKQDLASRWNVSHYPNFMAMMNIPTQSWQLQKAKYTKLLLEANSNRVEHQHGVAESFKTSFVVGFSGSSVTAGHGTLHILSTFSSSCHIDCIFFFR